MKLFTAIDMVTSRVGLLNRLVGVVADRLLPVKTARAACGPYCGYRYSPVIKYSSCGSAGPNKRYRFWQDCAANYKPGGYNPCSCYTNCYTISTDVVSC